MRKPKDSSTSTPIKTALMSVSDPTGLVDFAKALQKQGVEILATSGTGNLLRKHHIPITDISEYTAFPEILDGRVKTLHPKIHGGILARPTVDDDALKNHDIKRFDLVVVNLYPFTEAIADPKCHFASAIEQIDIGGPTLLRAAAKNHARVAVVCDPEDYKTVLAELKTHKGQLHLPTRFALAKKAFAHTAEYDAAIANYLGTLNAQFAPMDFPDSYHCQFIKKQDLQYGENPHQRAAFYVERRLLPGNIASAKKIQGKDLTYNNIADADAALECVKEFNDKTRDHTCVIVKHATPCGIACASTQLDAYQRAYATDKTSSYGGIIAFNQILEESTAQQIIQQQFVEIIIAPVISHLASEILKQKPNIRVLACDEWPIQPEMRFDYKRVNGGMLLQESDLAVIREETLQVPTQRKPTDLEMENLLFAWKAVKHVKSNAIVIVKDFATVGIGAGQMSRIDSMQLAILKAKEAGFDLSGALLASDAFFPFADAVKIAAEHNISGIIQPGGSIRDIDVITAANTTDMTMVMTGTRHFKH